jgi:hypothetical protein
MANMTTPAKLQNARFNFKPADPDDTCEECGSLGNIFICDSDFGPFTVALCLGHIDADYDPNAD